MGSPPSLSVVITTQNRRGLALEAIGSVLAAEVGVPAQQIIVVDDSSSDDTAESVQPLGVHYIRGRYGSVSRARNAGLAAVATDYVTFLDDDDLWMPSNMIAQLAALEANPGVAMALGRYRLLSFDGTSMTPDAFPPVPPGGSGVVGVIWVYEHFAQVASVLFRTSALRIVGGFDEAVRYMEDSDCEVRIAYRYPVVTVDAVGALFRQRPRDANETATRWHRFSAEVHRWLVQPQGTRIPFQVCLRRAFGYRARWSWDFVEDARANLRMGNRPAARKCLMYAVRVSPLHCAFRHPGFWSLARVLVLG